VTKRVFNYRSSGAFILIAFLLLWGGGFGGFPLLAKDAQYEVNYRPATPSQAEAMKWAFMAIGSLVFIGGLFLVVRTTNERIEIEGEEVRWFDWLGREKVRAPSSEVVSLLDGDSNNSVETSHGKIKFSRYINDAGLLRSILSQAHHGFSGWTARNVGRSVGSYIPAELTCGYQWTYLHFFSFLWLAVLGFMFVMSFSLGPADGPKHAAPWFMYAIVAVFAIPGVWMQLTAWNEKITIGPDGLRWKDCLGRNRVGVPLAEIISFDTQWVRGENSSSEQLRIFTAEGTVSASSYLRHYYDLKAELDRVIRSRQPASVRVDHRTPVQ
jgi:hypothetical protein